MATTNLAALQSSLTQSFIDRPANRFHSPVPLGALTTLPSKTKMSNAMAPETQSRSSFCRLSPSSTPSDGCHSTLMPKSVTRSQALGSSALRNDMVLPEQAPPCNHSRLAIEELRVQDLGWRKQLPADRCVAIGFRVGVPAWLHVMCQLAAIAGMS